MGLIKAGVEAIKSTLGDQWKEAVHCEIMKNDIILRRGTRMNQGQGSNYKGNPDVITSGSTINVEESTCMLTIDNGRITNIVTEPGQYKFDNSTAPSIFAGQIGESAKELLTRFTYGGTSSVEQRVVYINLQPLPGIPFGTGTPEPYPDPRYNTTVDLRFYGTFEIQILNAEMAVRFYHQVGSKGQKAGDITVSEIFKSEQYKTEFMQALSTALNGLAAEGICFNQIALQKSKLTAYAQEATRETWMERGFTIKNVGMGPVTLSEESKALLGDRLKADTMLGGDVQRAMMAGSVARGIEAAAGNDGGAMMGFMGMNAAVNTGGGILSQMGPAPASPVPESSYPQAGAFPGGGFQAPPPAPATPAPVSPVQAPAANSWKCVCGKENNGRFCANCGKEKPAPVATANWVCACGASSSGKFCSECGKPKPEAVSETKCPACGWKPAAGQMAKFCPECGGKIV